MIGNAYRYWRQRARPPAAAFVLARDDDDAGRSRYPRAAGNIGAESDGLRWIEDPAAAGLRFVGFADEIAPRAVEHRGWFIAPENYDEVYRGAVYRLPGRAGRARYVAGYREGSADSTGRWSDMSGEPAARVDLRWIIEGEADDGCALPGSAARDAAMAADEIARIAAELEREYQEAWAAGAEYQRRGEAIEEARGFARELLAEIKGARRAVPEHGAICRTLREKLGALRRDILESRVRRAELLAGHAHMRGTWRDRLWDAFADGADLDPVKV